MPAAASTPPTGNPLTTVEEIVRADLCIGCGLCEAVGAGDVAMVMNERGSLRPSPVDAFSPEEEATIVSACPGVVAEARTEAEAHLDEIWGAYRSMGIAWAGDPDVRFTASSGGVLTALGQHLLRSGAVRFVLHVGADPAAPTRSRWVVSETPEEVAGNSGSRYGPAAPLAGLRAALERDEPFAIIAKPCDLGALHRYAAIDGRVDQRCVARLAMVCGGQSRLTKTLGMLDGFGIAESDVTSLRYRGHGNPGPTSITTAAGREYALSYDEMWADESSWEVETRCKLCPDALGECADVAATDAWPGGAPVGEDEGFNAIVVRTAVGEEFVAAAQRAGALVVGDPITPRQLDGLQPHQVRKKIALAARHEGVAAAGAPPIRTVGLRVQTLGRRLDHDAWAAERDGTIRRLQEARR